MVTLAAALLGLSCLFASPPPATAALTFSAEVVGVHDGDTVTVLRGHDQVRVRLEGVDCPELGQAYGRRAKELTASLVFRRLVMVRGKEWDRHGRLVARVIVDGRDVSREVVAAGLAWHFRQYSTDEFLEAAERAARRASVGLWRDPSPIAPWEYRRAERR